MASQEYVISPIDYNEVAGVLSGVYDAYQADDELFICTTGDKRFAILIMSSNQDLTLDDKSIISSRTIRAVATINGTSQHDKKQALNALLKFGATSADSVTTYLSKSPDFQMTKKILISLGFDSKPSKNGVITFTKVSRGR